ncbi:DUF2662 domain-containing protein [Mycobacterium simiae]|uniref:DUF2662 domain-containing protein n=1 Tax=Mycobacterium simiae TaxID=1784 RepID=A0A5B1BGY8_MYCSI|nr:DUF3662 and FHA domain-containing protein [Mycobacterium simiae]KAA1246514.1 DUF2662 domain-containing protein [Mycobacterium simiae]
MGSQKGLAQRIERKLESTVGDAFARVFGGSIVPQEVEALLRREAADGVRSLPENRLLAPNEYIITLGVHDSEKLGSAPELTSGAFARYLADYIDEQGWQTYGDVVVRFERSPNLHTGQLRARAAVNPDVEPHPTGTDSARPQSNHALPAESGVPAMTDNSSYRGGQGQGRPDEYYDDRYAQPQEEQRGGPDPRGGYPPEAGGYPPQPSYPPPPRHPDQGGYPEPGGYPDQGPGGYPEQRGYQDQGQAGYPPPYDQHPPAPSGYGGPGYDQGYRQGGGYGQPPGGGYGQPPGGGYGQPPGGGYGQPPGGGQPGYGSYGDYGRELGRPDEGGYGAAPPPPAAPPEPPRPSYPEQGGGYEQRGYDQGYQQGGAGYGRPDYGPSDYTQYAEAPAAGGYAPQGGYAEPAAGNYDYGQPAAPDYGQPAGGGYAGYGQGGYGSPGTTVTLQLDDGSGRTYQLRDGSNIIGRGQDAQFRLPDTGVSRRHLEIRWDGQAALLTDLNSTNGTTVNNAPVQEWQLADGDVIRLGHSEIIVRIH